MVPKTKDARKDRKTKVTHFIAAVRESFPEREDTHQHGQNKKRNIKNEQDQKKAQLDCYGLVQGAYFTVIVLVLSIGSVV